MDKYGLAGHICRMSDELWTNKTATNWVRLNAKRYRGRLGRSCRGELGSYQKDWPAMAEDRLV